MTVSTLVAFLLAKSALEARANAGETVGLTLLAAITSLAVIEHWFMVVPIPTEKLWSWGLASHGRHRITDTTSGDVDRERGGFSSVLGAVPGKAIGAR